MAGDRGDVYKRQVCNNPGFSGGKVAGFLIKIIGSGGAVYFYFVRAICAVTTAVFYIISTFFVLVEAHSNRGCGRAAILGCKGVGRTGLLYTSICV